MSRDDGGRAVLHLVLTGHWFGEVASGRKTVEYRKITPHWSQRLAKRDYTHVCFSRGYTSKVRITRRITAIDTGPCPYEGWDGIYYRVHFEGGAGDGADRRG